ncbi:MAG: SH3 domain-containing protein [Saprospiraceae bacterium]|nr:SH3 domain-containing protein [Saprospiraceae bacterium]
MKTTISVLFLLFTFLTAGAQDAPFVPEELIVTANSLNLREEPNINSKKLASIPRGAKMQFLEAHDNGAFVQTDTLDAESPWAPWYKVRYQKQTGYVFGAHVSGRFNLYMEGDYMESMPVGLHWYGVYMRDSFADETRKIEVKVVDEYNEMYGAVSKFLRTNQPDVAKFLIATAEPLKTGFSGPTGVFDVNEYSGSKTMFPGATVVLHRGYDAKNTADTLTTPAYVVSALGCVDLRDNVTLFENYRLLLFDYTDANTPVQQDITPWFKTAFIELYPTISLFWQGDLDQDGKPDAVFEDCPQEGGCRISLLLSSEAKGKDRLKKVCESYFSFH